MYYIVTIDLLFLKLYVQVPDRLQPGIPNVDNLLVRRKTVNDVEKIDLTSWFMCVKNKKRLLKTTEVIWRLLMCFNEIISVGHEDLGELEAVQHGGMIPGFNHITKFTTEDDVHPDNSCQVLIPFFVVN